MNFLPVVYEFDLYGRKAWVSADGVSLTSARDYDNHYRYGYRLERVPPVLRDAHRGLRAALRRNRELAECADGEPIEVEEVRA